MPSLQLNAFPIGLGLLRLATEGRPNREEAFAIIHAALDAGIRLLDTADSYCLDEKEKHYGERLAKEGLDGWHGPRKEVVIATKAGMLRPKGKWVPDASPKQLKKGIDGSLDALGVERIPLFQLHLRDPRIPFEDTLGTLAELQKAGKIDRIGLCNVEPLEVRQAVRYFDVASIQNELNVMNRSAASDGSLEMARRMKIPFLAYRPLGGYAKVEKLATNRMLLPLVKKHQVTPVEMALAILLGIGDPVVPLIGARRIASLQSSLRSLKIQLDEEDRAWIRSKISFDISEGAKPSLVSRSIHSSTPKLMPKDGPGDLPEVVMLMGIQGAGKSDLVRAYRGRGYARLNRDELGGKLSDLIPELTRMIDEGEQRIVLDNTYPTRVSRMPVIDVAHYFGLPIRCRHLATPIQEARINVALRMIERYGKLFGPNEMKEYSKTDPNLPPPVAMQRWSESFEPPAMDEGFSAVEILPFERRKNPEWTRKGLLLDVDGTLRTTKSGELYPRSAEDVELLPGRRKVLLRWIERGYLLFFVSNQSGIASGKMEAVDADAAFQRTIELLDLPVAEVAYCPHAAFPAGCFCRKPMPGLAVELMIKHQLDPGQWIMVGDMQSDKEFAKGIGASYFEAEAFFSMME